ncbi:hypothetical protein [Rhizobium leguminosarum]|nr:hypothetical protein [Rhizobium leguminosarum]
METAFASEQRDPNEWIEICLADFDAPELHCPGGNAARIALQRIAIGRQVPAPPSADEVGVSPHTTVFLRSAALDKVVLEIFSVRLASLRAATDAAMPTIG